MRRLLFVFAFLTGCGVAPASPTSISRQPIVGGSLDPGDPQVGALWITTESTGMAQFCTAVLIGPQTMLSSAHCFANVVVGSSIFVSFSNNAFDVLDGGASIEVDDFQLDPAFTGDTSPEPSDNRDLAVLHLAEPVAGPYPALNRYPLDRLGVFGKRVRLVGFGRETTFDRTAGPRQQVTKTDYRVATDVELEAGAEGGLACRGDSGGPAFMLTPDSVDSIISIDSRGDTACEQLDISTRVDAELPLVQGFMSKHGDLPDCGRDGRCGFDCPAPDPDCPCAPDGFCTSACPAAVADPDCPESCLFDGGRCAPEDPPLVGGCASADGAGWLSLAALLLVRRRSRRR